MIGLFRKSGSQMPIHVWIDKKKLNLIKELLVLYLKYISFFAGFFLKTSFIKKFKFKVKFPGRVLKRWNGNIYHIHIRHVVLETLKWCALVGWGSLILREIAWLFPVYYGHNLCSEATCSSIIPCCCYPCPLVSGYFDNVTDYWQIQDWLDTISLEIIVEVSWFCFYQGRQHLSYIHRLLWWHVYPQCLVEECPLHQPRSGPSVLYLCPCLRAPPWVVLTWLRQ